MNQLFSRESGEFRLVGRVQVNQLCSGESVVFR